jgi:hypothetical protein
LGIVEKELVLAFGQKLLRVPIVEIGWKDRVYLIGVCITKVLETEMSVLNRFIRAYEFLGQFRTNQNTFSKHEL